MAEVVDGFFISLPFNIDDPSVAIGFGVVRIKGYHLAVVLHGHLSIEEGALIGHPQVVIGIFEIGIGLGGLFILPYGPFTSGFVVPIIIAALAKVIVDSPKVVMGNGIPWLDGYGVFIVPDRFVGVRIFGLPTQFVAMGVLQAVGEMFETFP